MYEKYLLQLEEAGKIRNLKERSINCSKNYVSYFLNYMEKHPEELTCQDAVSYTHLIILAANTIKWHNKVMSAIIIAIKK